MFNDMLTIWKLVIPGILDGLNVNIGDAMIIKSVNRAVIVISKLEFLTDSLLYSLNVPCTLGLLHSMFLSMGYLHMVIYNHVA